MDEDKKFYKVIIQEMEESKVADIPMLKEVYSQVFDYLNVKDVVKKLNGGF